MTGNHDTPLPLMMEFSDFAALPIVTGTHMVLAELGEGEWGFHVHEQTGAPVGDEWRFHFSFECPAPARMAWIYLRTVGAAAMLGYYTAGEKWLLFTDFGDAAMQQAWEDHQDRLTADGRAPGSRSAAVGPPPIAAADPVPLEMAVGDFISLSVEAGTHPDIDDWQNDDEPFARRDSTGQPTGNTWRYYYAYDCSASSTLAWTYLRAVDAPAATGWSPMTERTVVFTDFGDRSMADIWELNTARWSEDEDNEDDSED